MRLSVLLSALIGLAASQCYYPNGTKAENYKYRPCDAEDTTFSTCCIPDEGDICLPNGLCSYPDHYDYRAACSDKSWDKCQQVCPSTKKGSWVEVKTCATNEYCCNEDTDNGDCCKDGSTRFSLSSPDPASTTATAEPSATSNEPGSTKGVTTDVDEPTSTSTGESDSGLSAGAQGAIGGSIGGVAAIAIGVGAWWMLRRRRKAGGAAAELPAGEDGKKADGGYFNSGGMPPSEVEGSMVAVESDSRPVGDGRVHEMTG